MSNAAEVFSKLAAAVKRLEADKILSTDNEEIKKAKGIKLSLTQNEIRYLLDESERMSKQPGT